MDRHGISKAWISSVSGLVRDYRAYNNRLYEFTKGAPDRFVRFYTVNPNYPETITDEIGRVVETLGGKGIKLHPWLQAFSTDYPCVGRIVASCIRYHLPILFHDGTPPYSDCLQIANLAERFPEAKIILGHAGLYDLYRSAIHAAKRYKNIYLCLCGPAVQDIRQILAEVDNSRVFFGSDFGSQAVSILADRIKTVEYAIDNRQLTDKIFYHNANSML